MESARRENRAWYLLLLLPLAGTLVPTLYNAEDPALAGIPFFYWYQLLWVPLSVLATWVVYRKTRREH